MALRCNMPPERRKEAFDRFHGWYLSAEEEEAARECFDPILFYESLPSGRRQYWCTVTRQSWEGSRRQAGGKHRTEVICPVCNRPHELLAVNKFGWDMKSLERWTNAIFIHAEEDGALLIDAGSLKRSFSHNDLFGVLEWSPRRLYYMKPGELMAWKADWGEGWDRRRWQEEGTVREPFQPFFYDYDGSYLVIGAEQIEQSAFRYCRMREYFRLGYETDLYDVPRSQRYVVKYLASYAMYPTIEMAERLGFFSAIDDLILTGKKNARLLNWDGRTPAEFLRLSKADAKAFMRWEMDFADLTIWKSMAKELNVSNFCEYTYMCGGTTGFGYAKEGADKLGVNIKSVARYINRLGEDHRAENARTWLDYIKMAERLGYDLTEQTVILPKDLHARHDAAVKLTEYRQRPAEDEAYQNYYKKLCKKFAFTYGGLSVVVPEGSADIIREGKTLRHCVGGYAERHMSGKTVILFIRKERTPGRSFLTVELSADRKPALRQIHGYRNERYNNNAVSAKKKYAWFLDAWLGWVNAGSRRDRKGNPIIQEKEKTA